MYRISELNRLGRKVFHTNDLAILWKITNRHNLYMTITRYLEKGLLFPVYKGLYATVPLSDVEPLELGKAIIHQYTYLSTESVLSQAGILSQAIYAYTFIAGRSARVTVGPWSFRYRQLKDEYLYHPAGVTEQNGNFIATVERAVVDLLYYNARYHFDIPESIDFDKVKSLQKEIGYPHA